MSAFTPVTRLLSDEHPITILTPGRRRWGGDGPMRRGVGGSHLSLRREVGPRGGSHGQTAIDAIAVQTHPTEVSMHDR